MRKYRLAWIGLAAFVVLLFGYALGKIHSRQPSAGAQYNTIAAQSGVAILQTDASNTWQKITAQQSARTRHKSDPKSGDPRRSDQIEELPSGPFGSAVADLKQLADAGNADAAYALANGFRACEFFVPPKSDAETAQHAEDATVMQLNFVDQIVDQAKSVAEKQGQHIDNLPQIPVTSVYQGNLAASQEQIRQCMGVDTKAAKNWLDWQQRAAALGNPEAELAYWQLVLQRGDAIDPEDIVQDKQIAIAALQDSLSRGDSRALAAIGEVLEDGMFAEPDPYLAYAYFYAASQAPYADINSVPWIGRNFMSMLALGSNTQRYLQHHLDSNGSSLSAAQQLAAQQLGADLFGQCCQGNGG